jgi:hypothetical protein
MEEISVQPRYLAFFVLAAVCHYRLLSYWRSRLSDYKMNWIYNQTVNVTFRVVMGG